LRVLERQPHISELLALFKCTGASFISTSFYSATSFGCGGWV
jgi:hypothetical protein